MIAKLGCEMLKIIRISNMWCGRSYTHDQSGDSPNEMHYHVNTERNKGNGVIYLLALRLRKQTVFLRLLGLTILAYEQTKDSLE